MRTPIYVECENDALDERMERIKNLLREVERETAFLSTKGPMLYAVPAPGCDCISIGNITVYGVSDLNESEIKKMVALLEEFQFNRKEAEQSLK